MYSKSQNRILQQMCWWNYHALQNEEKLAELARIEEGEKTRASVTRTEKEMTAGKS
jgi:hypothetical protein